MLNGRAKHPEAQEGPQEPPALYPARCPPRSRRTLHGAQEARIIENRASKCPFPCIALLKSRQKRRKQAPGAGTHARKLNMARRQLNREQIAEITKQQILETPNLSDRQIARELGGLVSNPTVSKYRKELEQSGEVLNFNTSTGADGKQYPRQIRSRCPDAQEAHRAGGALHCVVDLLAALDSHRKKHGGKVVLFV